MVRRKLSLFLSGKYVSSSPFYSNSMLGWVFTWSFRDDSGGWKLLPHQNCVQQAEPSRLAGRALWINDPPDAKFPKPVETTGTLVFGIWLSVFFVGCCTEDAGIPLLCRSEGPDWMNRRLSLFIGIYHVRPDYFFCEGWMQDESRLNKIRYITDCRCYITQS